MALLFPDLEKNNFVLTEAFRLEKLRPKRSVWP